MDALTRKIYRSCGTSPGIRWDPRQGKRILLASHLQAIFVSIHSLSGELSRPRAYRTRRKQNGAVSLEAVILLPVFILIFAGILYVEKLWENRQQALLQARRCAWIFANEGCDEEKLPHDCIDVLQNADGLSESNELAESMNGGVLDGLSQVPLVGPVVEGLFASAFNSRARRRIQRTPVLGENTVVVVGSYYLMCNEKKRDILDLIKDAFCSTVGEIAGCS